MGVIVDRRPARIDPRLTFVDGREGLDLAGERVEEFEIGHDVAAFAALGPVGQSRRGSNVGIRTSKQSNADDGATDCWIGTKSG